MTRSLTTIRKGVFDDRDLECAFLTRRITGNPFSRQHPRVLPRIEHDCSRSLSNLPPLRTIWWRGKESTFTAPRCDPGAVIPTIPGYWWSWRESNSHFLGANQASSRWMTTPLL